MQEKAHLSGGPPCANWPKFDEAITSFSLQLFVEIARRAGDVHPSRNAALAVLHALHNARRLRALRAIGALLCIHDLLAVTGLGNLRHGISPAKLRNLGYPET